MAFTNSQKVSLAIITKCTAVLSLFGSGFIFQEIIRSKKKRNNMYHRLMLGMSTSDICSSLAIFIGNWAIPYGTEGVNQPYGNEYTCKIQGFFIQMSIVTPLYNAALSLYYLLMIKYSWREVHLKKIEPWLHRTVLLWGFGTSFSGVLWNQYHNSNLWCWISSTNEANILRWVYYYGPVWIVLFFVTVSMFMVYDHVRKHEENNSRHMFEKRRSVEHIISENAKAQEQYQKDQKKRHKTSKRVAKQSAWYVLAFYMSFVFATTTRLIQTINGKTYYPLLLLFAIFFPMQGFLNFIVYARPRVIQFKKKAGPNATTFGAIAAMLNIHSLLSTHESRFGVRNSTRAGASKAERSGALATSYHSPVGNNSAQGGAGGTQSGVGTNLLAPFEEEKEEEDDILMRPGAKPIVEIFDDENILDGDPNHQSQQQQEQNDNHQAFENDKIIKCVESCSLTVSNSSRGSDNSCRDSNINVDSRNNDSNDVCNNNNISPLSNSAFMDEEHQQQHEDDYDNQNVEVYYADAFDRWLQPIPFDACPSFVSNTNDDETTAKDELYFI